MNQLCISLNNFILIETLLIFLHVVINNIHHMDNKGKEQQSHIKYTQRQIFHEETHKGRKPLLLRNDRQSFSSVHHLQLRTNSI